MVRTRMMPVMALWLAIAVAAAAFVPNAGRTEAQTLDGTLLGTVVIRVGNGGGGEYGYSAGSYGSRVSGQWPAELFSDGAARNVLRASENGNGTWRWDYSGGAASAWLSDAAELDQIQVTVTYADQRDTRFFVMGSFISQRTGNTLLLTPPLPSREWDSRSGTNITMEFRQRTEGPDQAVSTPVSQPDPAEGSWVEFVIDTTPGGPVVAQYLIVLIVYGLWMWKRTHSAQSLVLAGIMLALTPWVPVIFNIGTPVAAAINTVNIMLGAYVYKYFFESREQYY